MAAQSVGETGIKGRPIYFVLAFLRLGVPIDRSSFSSLKTSQEILQEITPLRRAEGK